VISLGDPIAGGGQNLPLEDHVGQRLKAEIPGIADVVPIRFRRPNFRNTVVSLTALDAGKYYALNRARQGIPAAELDLYRRLRDEPGAVIVSVNLAEQHGVRAGETIEIDGPRGPVPLRVVGTVVDYSWNRGSLFMDRPYYQKQ